MRMAVRHTHGTIGRQSQHEAPHARTDHVNAHTWTRAQEAPPPPHSDSARLGPPPPPRPRRCRLGTPPRPAASFLAEQDCCPPVAVGPLRERVRGGGHTPPRSYKHEAQDQHQPARTLSGEQYSCACWAGVAVVLGGGGGGGCAAGGGCVGCVVVGGGGSCWAAELTSGKWLRAAVQRPPVAFVSTCNEPPACGGLDLGR